MREIVFHPAAPREARDFYRHSLRSSERAAERFWLELTACLATVATHPERFHFQQSGLRRCNLNRSPIHFLFKTFPGFIRVTVIRHDRRDPGFGLRRI